MYKFYVRSSLFILFLFEWIELVGFQARWRFLCHIQVNQRKPLTDSKREKDITGGIEATVTIKNGFYYGKILEIVLIGAVITENSFKRTWLTWLRWSSSEFCQRRWIGELKRRWQMFCTCKLSMSGTNARFGRKMFKQILCGLWEVLCFKGLSEFFSNTHFSC